MKLIHAGAEMKHMIDVEKLPACPVIVDAGASRAEFMKWAYLNLHRSWKYYVIEPSRDNCAVLRDPNHEKSFLRDCSIIGSALGGESGRATFTEFHGPNGQYHQWGNIYGNHKDQVQCERAEYEVEVIGINNLHARLGVDYIDYLKMDIEGAEYEVFRNMHQVTMRKIGQVSVEVHSREAREMVLRQVRRWRYNFIAEYGNEIYFTDQDRRKPVQPSAV